MLGHRSYILIALAVLALGALAAVALIQTSAHRPTRPTATTAHPTATAEPPPQPLDPRLLIPLQAFEGTYAMSDVPPSTAVMPIFTPYWDEEARAAFLETGDAGDALESTSGAFWYTWGWDGRIIYATRQRISVIGMDGRSRSIFSAGRIDSVYSSPDRRFLAVVIGRQLVFLDDRGVRHAVFDLRSAPQAAAWSPDGRRLAFSSGNSVYIAGPGQPPSVLARLPYVESRLSYPDKPVQVEVERIGRIAWSPSGRYLGYTAFAERDEPARQFGQPFLIIRDMSNGTSRVLDEGYESQDAMYSWTPVDDWIVISGNYGEPDSTVLLRRLTGTDSVPLSVIGTVASFRESSWRPGASQVAVREQFRYYPGDMQSNGTLFAPLSVISMQYVGGSRRPESMYNAPGVDLDLLAKRFSSGRIARASSGIPDFDWSRDGSVYAFIDRFYTFRQWDGKHPYPLGDSFDVLRVQAGDGVEHFVTRDGGHLRAPQFSPDAARLAYVSVLAGRSTLRVLPLSVVGKDRAQYTRWLQEGLRLKGRGDLDAAVPALRNAARLAPREPSPHRALMGIYQQLARRERNPYIKLSLLRAAQFEAEQVPDEEGRDTKDLIAAHLARTLENVSQPPNGQ